MPTTAAIERTILRQLVRAHKALRRCGERELGRLGLRVGQDMIVLRLADAGEMSQAKLAESLSVEPATASIMVGRLAKAGLVERRPVAADARVTNVRLTPRGRALDGPVRRVWADMERALSAGLTPAEVRALTALLARIRRNMESRRIPHADRKPRASTAR